MKTKTLFRMLLLPLLAVVLTSCEPSGQLLTGGVCTGIALFAVGGTVVNAVTASCRKMRF